MDQDWSFLKSNRFYGNIIIALGYWMQQADALTMPGVGKFFVVLGGLFVVVRTVDRFSEVIGSARSALAAKPEK